MGQIPSEEFAPTKSALTTKRFSLRAGLQFNYMLSNVLDINLEATFNATDDAFNGTRYDRKWDSYANVMLGLTYHFKDQ